MRTWCWNILDVVNNHVTSKQVHDLTITATVSKLSHLLKNTLTISIYWVVVYVQIEAYLSTNVIVCARHINLVKFVGDISTWSSVTLESRSPFLSKILYSFHLFNIPRIAKYYIRYFQSINTCWTSFVRESFDYVGSVCDVDTREFKHHIGGLNCSVVKHVPNRKIGTCWFILMI